VLFRSKPGRGIAGSNLQVILEPPAIEEKIPQLAERIKRKRVRAVVSKPAKEAKLCRGAPGAAEVKLVDNAVDRVVR
jgi:hypothetical protein